MDAESVETEWGGSVEHTGISSGTKWFTLLVRGGGCGGMESKSLMVLEMVNISMVILVSSPDFFG